MAVSEHIQEEGFQEVARRYFPDRVRDVTDEYGSYSVVDLESSEEQRLAAEEYIAHIAQRGVPKPSWWKEFLNKIRMWWNGTGWGKKFPVTTDQIEVLLARSSRKMRKHWYNRRSEVLIGGEGNGELRSGTDLNGGNGIRYSVDEQGKMEENGKVFYQIPFSNSVDAVLNHTYSGNGSVFMRDTPQIFIDMGFSKLPIMTTAKHIESIYLPKKTEKDHNHDLGELIKQIPEKLENPLMVITSETHPDTSVVVILELTDKNGDAVVVPILLNGRSEQNKIDAHIMTSAQGRANAFSKLAKNAVEKEKNGIPSVLYAQKKAESILNAEGVQFPNRYAFDSVTRNIADVGLKVKSQTETLQFKKWFGKSKVVDENGKPMVVYHQTGADFSVFDTGRQEHSNGDFETPIGIFLKPTDSDIGFNGKKQMALYARIRNPKVFRNRYDIQKFAKENQEYSSLLLQIKENDVKYHAIAEELDSQIDSFYADWRKKQNGDNRSDIESDPEYQRLIRKEDENIAEWGQENNKLGNKARQILTEMLKQQGFDGVIIKEDIGSFGRKTETFVAFEPTQVKSATDNIGTFDPENPDIRYSLDDYSEADHRDIVAILQPFVGQVVDQKESEYRKYLLEHGVDIPEDDAKAFAVEAMRANQKIARQRGIRKRDNWLYENYPLFRMVAEVAGDNFVINPEYTSSEGEHFTGSWIAPEFVKYSGPPKKFEEFSSAKLYQAYLARREKALKHAKGTDLSDIAEAISRKTGRDSLTLKEEIKDFFRDLKKKEFYGRYTEWKKNQAFEDRALRDAAMAEWQQQEKFRIEDEVISILQNGLEIQHKTKGEKNIFLSLLLNFI